VACAVLKKLIDIIKIEIDLSEIENASDYFEEQVNQLVKEDPKLQEVISKLEEVYKRSEKNSTELKKEEGLKDDKVIYIQAFLKKLEDGEKKES
jgi:proteasome assembly chaperone (PAC2) family protein